MILQFSQSRRTEDLTFILNSLALKTLVDRFDRNPAGDRSRRFFRTLGYGLTCDY